MLEVLGLYIKLGVDIQKDILDGGGELHSSVDIRSMEVQDLAIRDEINRIVQNLLGNV